MLYSGPLPKVKTNRVKGLRTMKHIKMLSEKPVRAADIPVEDKVTFIVAILNAFVPILSAKDPQ